eukprot:12008599-Karenia_brevis.AAC.1
MTTLPSCGSVSAPTSITCQEFRAVPADDFTDKDSSSASSLRTPLVANDGLKVRIIGIWGVSSHHHNEKVVSPFESDSKNELPSPAIVEPGEEYCGKPQVDVSSKQEEGRSVSAEEDVATVELA